MDEILEPLAFALLIGGQFLAAIVLISKRKTIYADPHEQVHEPACPTEGYPKVETFQQRGISAIALARLELAQRARAREPQRSREAAAD